MVACRCWDNAAHIRVVHLQARSLSAGHVGQIYQHVLFNTTLVSNL